MILEIEKLSTNNLLEFIKLGMKLWRSCDSNDEKQYYANLLSDNNHFIILLKVAKNYIGFAHAAIRSDYVRGAEKSPVAYLEGIYVEHQFRKKGFATKLVHEVEKWALSKGIYELASDTTINNEISKKFHQGNGF